MARRKSKSKNQPLIACTHTLTGDVISFLDDLSQEASDALGWTVASSAVVRALVRHAEQQHPSWVSSVLIPIIAEEIKEGVTWGGKKK